MYAIPRRSLPATVSWPAGQRHMIPTCRCRDPSHRRGDRRYRRVDVETCVSGDFRRGRECCLSAGTCVRAKDTSAPATTCVTERPRSDRIGFHTSRGSTSPSPSCPAPLQPMTYTVPNSSRSALRLGKEAAVAGAAAGAAGAAGAAAAAAAVAAAAVAEDE